MSRALIDQTAHFAAGFVILSAFAFGGIPGGAVAGFGIGLVREISESGTPVQWLSVKQQLTKTDAPLDLLFWALGGAAAALIFE